MPIFMPFGHRCQVSEIGILLNIFINLQLHLKILRGFPMFSEHFRTLPKISEKLRKFSKNVGRSF